MEESSPACGERFRPKSLYFVNMIYHVLSLICIYQYFIYAHYRLHPKVENTSFN